MNAVSRAQEFLDFFGGGGDAAGCHCMPGPAIVRWYADAGGNRITTGTDSHTDRTIGAGVPLTLEMLRLCGVPNVMSFRNRVGTPVPIERLLKRQVA